MAAILLPHYYATGHWHRQQAQKNTVQGSAHHCTGVVSMICLLSYEEREL